MRHSRLVSATTASRQDRDRKSFHEYATITFPGPGAWSDMRLGWHSRALDITGHTLIRGYVDLDVISDTGPAGSFALALSLSAIHGSGQARGGLDGVWWTFPLAPAAWPGLTQWYQGPGSYAVTLLGPAARGLDVMALQARMELWVLGEPEGRTMAVEIDGQIVAGRRP